MVENREDISPKSVVIHIHNIVNNYKVNTLYFGFKLNSFRNNELINVDGLTVSKYVYRKTVQQRIGQQ